MRYKILITLTILINTFNSYGQLKKVGYSQLANDIYLSEKENVVYKNVHFINDLPDKGAEVFETTYIDSGAPWTIFGGFKKYLESKRAIKDSKGLFISKCKSIEIEDFKFENDIRFSNVYFNGSLSLDTASKSHNCSNTNVVNIRVKYLQLGIVLINYGI